MDAVPFEDDPVPVKLDDGRVITLPISRKHYEQPISFIPAKVKTSEERVGITSHNIPSPAIGKSPSVLSVLPPSEVEAMKFRAARDVRDFLAAEPAAGDTLLGQVHGDRNGTSVWCSNVVVEKGIPVLCATGPRRQ